jgi:3-hydroxybutyryl-CoA dehydrogenase
MAPPPGAPADAPPVARLAVVGAGTLGWQIACLALAHGLPVALTDLHPPALATAQARINTQLASLASSGAWPLAATGLARLTLTPSLAQAVHDADLVIEAIPEVVALKRALFTDLDRLAPPDALLATNSSSFRSALLADAISRPERVLNMHFSNFPWQRRFLEIMSCGQTTAANLARAAALGEHLGLYTVVLRGEVTGFLYGRIWRAVKRECLSQLARGLASVEAIDMVCAIGLGMPEGPFRRMDRIGLDVILAIEEHYYAESGDPADAPPAFLRQMVADGQLGRKTGRGFYDYTADG